VKSERISNLKAYATYTITVEILIDVRGFNLTKLIFILMSASALYLRAYFLYLRK
jgi:hypothetical protein